MVSHEQTSSNLQADLLTEITGR
ncbi:protein of unknown function [Pseudomonas mediterranea]